MVAAIFVVAAILVLAGGRSSENKLRSTISFFCRLRAPLQCMHVEHISNGIEEIKLFLILNSRYEIGPHGSALDECGTKKT